MSASVQQQDGFLPFATYTKQ